MANLLVVAEQRNGELSPTSLECVSALKGVKQDGDQLSVVVVAEDPGALVSALSVPDRKSVV